MDCLLALGALTLWWRRRVYRTAHQALPFSFIAGFGQSIAAANYFYYSAISSLPVAVAIVIQYTAPALVVLWLALAERKSPSRRVVWALAFAFAGVALLAELPGVLTSGKATLSGRGIAAALVSAVAFAAYILIGERVVPAYGPEGALARGFGIASVGWIVIQATRGRPDTLLDGSLLPGVILIGIVATIIPFMLFLWGLQRIVASKAWDRVDARAIIGCAVCLLLARPAPERLAARRRGRSSSSRSRSFSPSKRRLLRLLCRSSEHQVH